FNICNKGCCNSKDNKSLLKGDIMIHVKNIFLVLVFALSAAAFSTSATAASNSPPAHKPGDLPDIGDIVLPPPPDWCKKYPPGTMRPPELAKICQWNK
ncbi:hypothetical protein AIP93_11550, partial [Salmonella enterica]|nr:hypothetical protein [Salmonella enterica]